MSDGPSPEAQALVLALGALPRGERVAVAISLVETAALDLLADEGAQRVWDFAGHIVRRLNQVLALARPPAGTA
ncbi:MAG: hypothetical protein KGN77_02080 [Xanthomonadaceae bacterium]|nr:hypothetical protein [Xanthomonadaceae bacterium]